MKHSGHSPAFQKAPDTLNCHHNRAGGLGCGHRSNPRLVREGFSEETLSSGLEAGRRGVLGQETGLNTPAQGHREDRG